MNTDLALLQPDQLTTLERTGKLLAASGYFDAKGNLESQMAQMAVKIMAGAELGFGPFASANGIHIINGKPTVSANLMATAVRSSRRYDYRVVILSATECEIEFFALAEGKRESLGISRFDTADADKAGLINKPIWKNYPKNLLFARAMSNGVRFYCPDVFGGNAVYVAEELGDETYTDPDLPPSARVVDGATGEILQPQDEDMGMGDPQPRKLGSITRAQEKELHSLGWATYNGGWDDKRHELVSKITKGKYESSHDLTQAQAQTLIDGLHKRLVERIETTIRQQGILLDDVLKPHNQPSLADASPVALTHIWRDVKPVEQPLQEAA